MEIGIAGRYATLPGLVAPDDGNATIWRYVDFTKFVSLLDSRCLYFARCDRLDDSFEGSSPEKNVHHRLTDPFFEGMPEDWAGASIESERLRTFVNCWNLSDRESAALWGLYVPPQGGVAIQSTFRRLTESFDHDHEDEGQHEEAVLVGKVRYIDYANDKFEPTVLAPFFHKRHSFEFESEVRALINPLVTHSHEEPVVVPPPDGTVTGMTVRVDLERLVEAIYISPTAPDWFADLVRSLALQYGCMAEVRQSDLAKSPIY